ncbi:MAG: hypothetical protein K6G50_09460 [bacterium]|nr:hypothetical protein [bacterium]
MTGGGKYQKDLNALIGDEPKRKQDSENEYRSYSLVTVLIICSIVIVAGIFLGFKRIPRHPDIYIPDYSSSPQDPQSQVRYCEENVRIIAAGVEYYAAQNGGKYPEKLEDVYTLCKIRPVCPRCNEDTYSAGYELKDGSFIVRCKGSWHAAAGLPENFPAYNSVKGKMMP